MEVHHAHHPAHKKKWSEYLLEFFMLFLAVFLGFIAENIREGYVERHREHQYIASMVKDLETDTTKLGHNIRSFDRIAKGQDSILKDFDNIGKMYSPLIRRNINYLTGYPDFIYTDGTIQQLKNSGGMRLLHHRQVVDSILVYDSQVQAVLLNQSSLANALTDLSALRFEVFNYRAIDSLDAKEPKDPELVLWQANADKAKFYSKIRYYHWMLTVVQGDMMALKEKATATLLFVKKEYGLSSTGE